MVYSITNDPVGLGILRYPSECDVARGSGARSGSAEYVTIDSSVIARGIIQLSMYMYFVNSSAPQVSKTSGPESYR